MPEYRKEASLPGCAHAEAGKGLFRVLADWYVAWRLKVVIQKIFEMRKIAG